jgi:hypothetical protein
VPFVQLARFTAPRGDEDDGLSLKQFIDDGSQLGLGRCFAKAKGNSPPPDMSVGGFTVA